MNWFTIAGMILHVLKNVPDMVDDVEDLFNKLTNKEPPPDTIAATVNEAITAARAA